MFTKTYCWDNEKRNPLGTKETHNKTINFLFKIWNANVRTEQISVITIQFTIFFAGDVNSCFM